MNKAPQLTKTVLPGHLDPGRIDHLLGYQIALASIPTNTLFKKYIGDDFQVSKVEFTILMLLSSNDSVTPKRLSSAMNLPAPNLTLVLDKLERRHLLSRVRSDSDRRVTQLSLAPEGKRMVKRMQPVVDDMETELLKYLSPAETAMLFELLKKISSHRRV
jgi:DNA-binding MarR family transcriptional regulator